MGTKNRLKWWTVICLYPDYLANDFGSEWYVDFTKAPTAIDAGLKTRAKLAQEFHTTDEEDFKVLAVMKGKVYIEAGEDDF